MTTELAGRTNKSGHWTNMTTELAERTSMTDQARTTSVIEYDRI